ncbi:M16 family metallopeptidase [Pseudobdellovibrio exovorus]|uniref:Zinc proteinase n=1 Tax=Pseudobdellovibrio exovorus JSS TaxID=1184267 RepID=M4V961_9BACT|nr:pitrilysin family protein [Pseudobdellovibrio exovorus]AGH95763.1 zinc proteinase [Pseudobdellovibrio exovorus JSS]
MDVFKKSVLPNGVRIVTEHHPHSKSVSIGVWVLTGTRDEKPEEVGISHFVEHLVFKGTKTRNAYQIAKSLESLGGELNAYTTREYTNYHCTVLKEDWRIGLEVLADLVCNMKISQKDFDLEKKVILQEIAMCDDLPEELIYDYFYEGVYKNHPLSRQILGQAETITKMTQKKIFEFYRHFYQGKNLIISAAGPLEHDQLVIECQRLFKNRKKFSAKSNRRAPRWKRYRKIFERDMEQAHVLVGLPSTSFNDKFRFEALVLNSLLGGGMTSRLYQAIREKQGLAYTVFSSLNTNVDSGNISVYAGTDSANVKKVMQIIKDEFAKLKKQGVRSSDLTLFKTQVRGQLLMGSDDIENRMSSLGVNEMVFERYKPVSNVIEEIEKISVESMNQYIAKYLDLDKMSVVLMGPNLQGHQQWLQDFDFSKN